MHYAGSESERIRRLFRKRTKATEMPKSNRESPLVAWCDRLVDVWREGRADKKADRRLAAPTSATLSERELSEVVAGVKQLSLGLTRERKLVGQSYMDNPKLLGAYLLFYWPISYAQARSALGELGLRPKSVLDLGAGPGPMSFAAIDAGARYVVAADRSKPALELARTLAVKADESLATRQWTPGAALPEGQFDLIILGHALNEFYAGDVNARVTLLESLLQKLEPTGTLMVLEPALKETSRALLSVRDKLVARGYALKAPCLFQGACPALVKESDWCHAERGWALPPLVERIAKLAGLHKDALKMSYLLVSPKGAAWPQVPEGNLFRIVSEPLPGKGRLRYMGCGPQGRMGLALQEKHRVPYNEAFFSLQRGDVVSVSGSSEKGDGLGLDETSDVRRLAKAGQPFPPLGTT